MNFGTRHLAAVGLCLAALAPATAAAQVTPTTFASMNGPIGVAVAADGSVFATYDGIGDVRLVKFNPQGQVVREVAFGNVGSVGEIGKLAIDPVSGTVWDLFTTGEIRLFDPNTLASASLGTLRATPIDRSSVHDVSQGRRRDMSGEIVPELSTFGDISLLRTAGGIDLFATGRSSSGVPFVVRARFNAAGAFVGARAVAAASISSQEDNAARGVAVNAAGTVLTTLPTPNPRLDVQDLPYTFSATFPEAGQAPRIALGGRDLASRGMATDAAGNFYVTGFIGSTICARDAAGAIIILSPNAARAVCHPFSATPVNMEDVAVGPPAAQNTFSSFRAYPGRILLWGRLAVPAAVAGDVNANCGAKKKQVRRAARRVKRLRRAARNAEGAAQRKAKKKLKKARKRLRRAKKRRARAC